MLGRRREAIGNRGRARVRSRCINLFVPAYRDGGLFSRRTGYQSRCDLKVMRYVSNEWRLN